jgi:hypothetical protein
MNERQRLEQEIREVLDSDAAAIELSNKLFSPNGLFNQLTKTESERRIIAQTSLFRKAQRRLTSLQQKEAAEFARNVQQAEAIFPQGDAYVLKLERAEST